MQKLISKLKGIPRFYLITLLVVALLLIGATAYFLIAAKPMASRTQSSTVSSETKKISLAIESEPVGIAMTSEPDCDVSQSQKITPYTCEFSGEVSSALITAPQEVSQSGKTYAFQNWEGCSEPNENKILCRVAFSANTPPTIKAVYSEQQSSAATNNTSKTKPNTPAGNNSNAPATPTSEISSRQCQDSLAIDAANNLIACAIKNPYQIDIHQAAFTNPSGLLGGNFILPITIRCANNCTLKQGSSSQEVQGNVATAINNDSTYSVEIYGGDVVHISAPYTSMQTANQQQVNLKFAPFAASSSGNSYEIYIPPGYGGIGYVYHLPRYYVQFSYSQTP